MEKKKRILSLVLLCCVSMGIGAGCFYLTNKKKIDFMNRYPQFLEVEKLVTKNFEIEKPGNDDDALAINAYLSLYGDKYTCFVPAEDTSSKEFVIKKTNESAVAYGSGFEVDFDENDRLYLSAVKDGMAAEKQGFKQGDVILKVDGTELVEYEDAEKFRSKGGTESVVTIERDGKTMDINFVREADTLAANGIFKKKYGDTLYVRLKDVGMFVAVPFLEAVDAESFDSLILDLRDNPGGSSDIVTTMLDPFIGEAKFELHGKNGEVYTKATTNDIKYNVKIVVLVNEKTASAAEIITALLKQYGDATIVGTKTFGKGIYQLQAMYKNGTINYTDGYVIVGDWDCYHEVGIMPDVEVEMDSSLIGSENDIQLEKALEIISDN